MKSPDEQKAYNLELYHKKMASMSKEERIEFNRIKREQQAARREAAKNDPILAEKMKEQQRIRAARHREKLRSSPKTADRVAKEREWKKKERDNFKAKHGITPHKAYLQTLNGFINKLYGHKKDSQKGCSISKEDLVELWNKQNGKCAITGIDLVYGKGRLPNTASLDRIDSSKGYHIDNIRFICLFANQAISNWGEDVLREYVNHIVANNPNSPCKYNLSR